MSAAAARWSANSKNPANTSAKCAASSKSNAASAGCLRPHPTPSSRSTARAIIQLVNRVGEKIFGYDREDLLGQPVELLIPEELRAKHVHHRSQYWNHPHTRPMGTGLALEGRRKDGSRFPVEISLSPVESGDAFYVTAVIRDVTERKRVEEQLRAVQER